MPLCSNKSCTIMSLQIIGHHIDKTHLNFIRVKDFYGQGGIVARVYAFREEGLRFESDSMP